MRSSGHEDDGVFANGAGPERQGRRPPVGVDGNGGGPAGTERFLDAFESLTQAIRRARGASAQDTPGQLTFSQYALLRALAGRDAARVSDLAGDAEITPSTATRILDALERRAIVSRARSAEDRRGVTVTLTEHGREALARQDAWMRGRQQAFYEQLPDGERELASGLLVRMAALIDELSAGPAQ
jgi:DNA-binding MarR family transcriptional regulator